MSPVGLLFFLVVLAYLSWVGSIVLTRPSRALQIDVPLGLGFVVFAGVAYAQAIVNDFPGGYRHMEGLYVLTTLTTALLATIVLRRLPGLTTAAPGLEPPAPVLPRVSSEEPRRLARMAVLVVVAAIIKLNVANPLLPFDPERSNYETLSSTMLAVSTPLVACELALSLHGARRVAGMGLALAAVLVGAVDQSRTPMTYVAVGIAILAIRRHARKSIFRPGIALSRYSMLLGGPVAFALLVALAGLIKVTGGRVTQGLDPQFELDAVVTHTRTHGYTDVFENTCFIEENFGTVYEYEPGQGLYAVIAGAIPRQVWPEKPIGLSRVLTLAKLGPSAIHAGTSLSPGLVGELWMNGGWLGIWVGAPALAVLLWGIVQFLLRLHRLRGWVIAPAWAALWVMALLQPRGDFYTITVRGGTCVVGALLCARFVFRPGGPVAPPRAPARERSEPEMKTVPSPGTPPVHGQRWAGVPREGAAASVPSDGRSMPRSPVAPG